MMVLMMMRRRSRGVTRFRANAGWQPLQTAKLHPRPDRVRLWLKFSPLQSHSRRKWGVQDWTVEDGGAAARVLNNNRKRRAGINYMTTSATLQEALPISGSPGPQLQLHLQSPPATCHKFYTHLTFKTVSNARQPKRPVSPHFHYSTPQKSLVGDGFVAFLPADMQAMLRQNHSRPRELKLHLRTERTEVLQRRKRHGSWRMKWSSPKLPEKGIDICSTFPNYNYFT